MQKLESDHDCGKKFEIWAVYQTQTAEMLCDALGGEDFELKKAAIALCATVLEAQSFEVRTKTSMPPLLLVRSSQYRSSLVLFFDIVAPLLTLTIYFSSPICRSACGHAC